MTSQQLEQNSQNLEQRVKALETELLHIKKQLAHPPQSNHSWWLKISGSFEEDPTFDEAVHLGQEWRKTSQEF